MTTKMEQRDHEILKAVEAHLAKRRGSINYEKTDVDILARVYVEVSDLAGKQPKDQWGRSYSRDKAPFPDLTDNQVRASFARLAEAGWLVKRNTRGRAMYRTAELDAEYQRAITAKTDAEADVQRRWAEVSRKLVALGLPPVSKGGWGTKYTGVEDVGTLELLLTHADQDDEG